MTNFEGDPTLLPSSGPPPEGVNRPPAAAPMVRDNPFVEDVTAGPDERPWRLEIPPHMQKMQKWSLFGLGGLTALAIIAVSVVAVWRPELHDVVTSMSQLLFGGLIGLGGSVVGYLFAERKGD